MIEFVNSLQGQVTIISICVILVLITLLITIKYIVKNKKHILIKVNKKDRKEDDGQKLDIADTNNDNKYGLGQIQSNVLAFNEEFYVQQIKNHRFFSAVQYRYVDVDYGFEYDIYNLLLQHKIKNESQDLVEFKKLIATRFLSDCVFKFLRDTMQEYVKTVLSDYNDRKARGESMPNNAPSLCGVIENIFHFTKSVQHLAGQTVFQYKNKTIEGIPFDFVKYFCRVISKDITTLSSTFSNIIYATNGPWYIKVNEILDFLELVIVYIKESVDATLVVLNGQLQKFVDDLFKDDKYNQ